MLFNSFGFLVYYLPVTLAGFFFFGWLRRYGAAALWLGAMSLVFYGWDNPTRLLPIILGSMAFNFIVGRFLARKHSKALLWFGIAGNLGLLGYYKYADFFLSNLAHFTALHLPVLGIALPIGISFYTFTQIAFLVDAYRGQAHEYKPIHYLLFVSFFPHLIAGPILHHKEMMPQFAEKKTYSFNPASFILGLSWFAAGLFKKVILADHVGAFVKPVFSKLPPDVHLGFADAWLGAIAYTLQIYFDFSGYSDMAIGLSLLIGIRLPLNFNSPYQASSMIEFWRRWHMTLSRFLRDYLYIPLGGNRKGKARRYANLLATMLLGGMWHGASWNFLVWGGIHGAGLAFNHLWRDLKGWPIPALEGWVLTSLLVIIAWVPFRAATLDDTLTLWHTMLPYGQNQLWKLNLFNNNDVLWWTGTLAAIAVLLPNTQTLFDGAGNAGNWLARQLRWRPHWVWALAAGAAFGAAFGYIVIGSLTEFLYFKF